MTDSPRPIPEGAIAVVGIAGRYPGAPDLEAFRALLRSGRSGLAPLAPEQLRDSGVDPAEAAAPGYVAVGGLIPGMRNFDAGFFGFSPREAEILDPQHRHFYEMAWEAFEDAARVPGQVGIRTGVFASCGASTYLWRNLLSHPELERSMGWFLLRHTGNDKDFLATRVAYLLDLHGPAVTVQTACSSSLVAIHLACQSLLSGECDQALAGGITIRQPHAAGYLPGEGALLSHDGICRPWDADSTGSVFSSGGGVVLLRRAADALRDGDPVRALILGSAVNNDGARKAGYLAPSEEGQAEAVAEALAVAGVEPDTLGYVEGHGMGTPLGDPIEIAALTLAFRGAGSRARGSIPLGSGKSAVGHLDTASGVAALTRAILALEDEEIPPTLHFRIPHPEIDFANSPFRVADHPIPWKRGALPRRAGVHSLGVGGTNAHVVVEEAPPLPLRREDRTPHEAYVFLPLSAPSAPVLRRRCRELAAWIEEHPGVGLADLALTLQTGRRAFSVRVALVVRSASEAVDALRLLDPEDPEHRVLLPGFAAGSVPAALRERARRWVTGESLEQPVLPEGTTPRRLHLPGNPFDSREYWIPPAGLAGRAGIPPRAAGAGAVGADPGAPVRAPVPSPSLVERVAAHPALAGASLDQRDGLARIRIVVRPAAPPPTPGELRRWIRDGGVPLPEAVEFEEVVSRSLPSGTPPPGAAQRTAPDPSDGAPRTADEEAVARVWKELIGIEEIGRHDNFLDSGGHSLLAIRAVVRIEGETGVRLPPGILTLHTLEQVAAEIGRRRQGEG